ncbi:hypothetical protein AC1031_013192 [Aphanomyces cochlioides]|nr:hypothetical protein AC1031_013192 [Aphanomyces cochlioides]
MSFSFPSSNMSDVDMMFDVDPVPFGELEISSPDSDLDRHDLDILMGQGHPMHVMNDFVLHHHPHHHPAVAAPIYAFPQPNGHHGPDQIKVEVAPTPPTRQNNYRQKKGSLSPPSSETSRSQFQTDEELLAQPVGNLTEEEKKLRRRAQVAKSARKHRKGVKEELEMLRQQVKYLQEQMAIKCAINDKDAKKKTNGTTLVAPEDTVAAATPVFSFTYIEKLIFVTSKTLFITSILI